MWVQSSLYLASEGVENFNLYYLKIEDALKFRCVLIHRPGCIKGLHIIIIRPHVLIWISVLASQPEVLEQIHSLKELWLDNNSLQSIPGVRTGGTKTLSMTPCYSRVIPYVPPQQFLGKLRQLRYLDLAKNRIETLDTDISGCEALEDLLLSSNMLQHLPDSIGNAEFG